MNAEALCGKVLGSCTLQKVIGRGTMSAVYLAQQSRPNRQVAVRVLLPNIPLQSSSRTAFLERFRHETDAAALLQHPNIMPVHEYGETDGLAYLVMPYISGGTLQDELRSQGKLPLTRIVFYLEQMAAALDFAHEHGVIHRDIKPSNIMLTPEKRILLTDFGLVQVASNGHDILSNTDISISTYDYMAPEQFSGATVDARTDTYSLGVLLYQLVTGALPFKDRRSRQAQPVPPCTLRSDLPVAAEQVILHAIASRPTERYTYARDMAREFRSQLEDAGVQVDITYPNLAAQVEHISSHRPRTRSLLDPLWRTDTSSVTAISTTGASALVNANSPIAHSSTNPAAHSFQQEIAIQQQIAIDSLIDTAGHAHIPTSIHTDKQLASSTFQYPPTNVKERNKLPVNDMNNQSRPTYQNQPVQDQPLPSSNPANSLVLPPHLRPKRKTSLHGWQSEKIPTVSSHPSGNLAQPTPTSPNFSTYDPFAILDATPSSGALPPSQESAPPPLPKRASLNIANRTQHLGNAQSDAPTQQFNQPQFPLTTQPTANITRQLTNTTGMLPGATGALMYPPGEYSGDTGMLKLNQPVKVVRVPIAGQPGQYMTGILPVQPRTNALPPLTQQNPQPKKYSKILLLAMLALVLILGSGGFFLLRQSTQQQRTQNVTSRQLQIQHATATAQANAQATAAVNNVVLYDPLSTNINGWPVVMKDHGRSYFFKNNAYHIRQDGTFLAYAYMANEIPPTNFAYTLTMQQISGDNTVDFNYYGPILRYSNNNGHITFYMFKVINNKAQTKYQFLSYDSKNAANPWSDPIWQKNTGKEFHGAKRPNTVKIVIEKNTFTFSINGTRLGQAHNSTLTSGNVGLGVSHQGNETAFTNLLLTHQ